MAPTSLARNKLLNSLKNYMKIFNMKMYNDLLRNGHETINNIKKLTV